MGECDLTLLDAPHFDKADPLSVMIRTTGRWEYSYVESAAAQIGDTVLEVGSFGTYFLDGVDGARLAESKNGKSMAGKYPVSHKQINKKNEALVAAKAIASGTSFSLRDISERGSKEHKQQTWSVP